MGSLPRPSYNSHTAGVVVVQVKVDQYGNVTEAIAGAEGTTVTDMTLIDFVLYDKTTKRPVLTIEVDGMSYHKEGTRQWERDRMKDSVLEKMGLPLLRLPTNGKQEKERIESALLSIFSDVQEPKNGLQK